MILESQRLILREYQKGDKENLVKSFNNLKMTQYLFTPPFPYFINDAESFINRTLQDQAKIPRENFEFAITLKGTDKVIGGIGIKHISEFEKAGTMGYWLNEEFWRKGIMTEAALKLMKFCFEELKLRRLNAEVFVPNEASNKLVEKLGFKLEGTRIQMHRSKSTGLIHDSNSYGILNEEWQKRSYV
jgi:ribosomal-protein-alanine N-acetyltransferase